jgi:hypothetical protein
MPISAEQEEKIKEIYHKKKGWHSKFSELVLKNLVNYYYDNSNLSALDEVRADPFTFIVTALEDADESFTKNELDSYLSGVLQIPQETAKAKVVEEMEKEMHSLAEKLGYIPITKEEFKKYTEALKRPPPVEEPEKQLFELASKLGYVPVKKEEYERVSKRERHTREEVVTLGDTIVALIRNMKDAGVMDPSEAKKIEDEVGKEIDEMNARRITVTEAYDTLKGKLDVLLARKPTKPVVAPPTVAPTELEETIRKVIREVLGPYVTAPEKPRAPKLINQVCPICGKTFARDLDLEERVRMYEVSYYYDRHTGKTFKVPLIDYPEEFFMLCPEHRFAKYGYTDIYDVLGWLMFRTKHADRFVTRHVTELELREAGLTEDEIEKIKDYAKAHEEETKKA